GLGFGFRRRRGRAARTRRGARAEAREALVEARELTAGIEETLLPAGPGRVRLGVDVEAQRVAFLAIGRARLVAAAVGHHDGDLVIIGVNLFLHGSLDSTVGRLGPGPTPIAFRYAARKAGVIGNPRRQGKPGAKRRLPAGANPPAKTGVDAAARPDRAVRREKLGSFCNFNISRRPLSQSAPPTRVTRDEAFENNLGTFKRPRDADVRP